MGWTGRLETQDSKEKEAGEDPKKNSLTVCGGELAP